MSKYLSIPLRYRIVCNSSRSAIQEDGTTILPLFQSRVVERYFLDRGMFLLDRNVESIAKSCNVKCGGTAHILAKMKRIYDKIVDGRWRICGKSAWYTKMDNSFNNNEKVHVEAWANVERMERCHVLCGNQARLSSKKYENLSTDPREKMFQATTLSWSRRSNHQKISSFHFVVLFSYVVI